MSQQQTSSSTPQYLRHPKYHLFILVKNQIYQIDKNNNAKAVNIKDDEKSLVFNIRDDHKSPSKRYVAARFIYETIHQTELHQRDTMIYVDGDYKNLDPANLMCVHSIKNTPRFLAPTFMKLALKAAGYDMDPIDAFLCLNDVLKERAAEEEKRTTVGISIKVTPDMLDKPFLETTEQPPQNPSQQTNGITIIEPFKIQSS